MRLRRRPRSRTDVPGAARADRPGEGPDAERIGLRIGRPGTGPKVQVLDYDALRAEQLAADEAEERRLFYVAMTRAQERLVLSGAAKMDTWEKGNRSIPVDWIVPAFVPDVASRVDEDVIDADPGIRLTFVREDNVTFVREEDVTFVREDDLVGESAHIGQKLHPSRESGPFGVFHSPLSEPVGRTAVGTLSYSSLAEYERCGYRFYVERVLGLPPEPGPDGDSDVDSVPAAGPGALERGTLVHALLQRLDFSRLALPPGTPPELEPLLAAFIDSDLCTRLGRARELRREQRFAFVLDGTLVTGTFDVLASEPDRGGRLLVVDYKTGGVAPYATQALIYAIAALRTGAPAVEVVHTFLDAGEASARAYDAGDLPALEADLSERAAGLLAGRFDVAQEPKRALCAGCPALGGLCSWPAEVAMRESPDRLF